MMSTEIVAKWDLIRRDAYAWRTGLAVGPRIVLCMIMAGLTGLLAQVRVVLPWTPVPVTGQVFAVLLAGVLMGRRYGAVSQALYVAVGVAGVPWFAGWSSGSVLGPTGGYLLGFIPAAALVGHVTDDRWAPSRARLAGAMVAGVTVIYFCGALQFALTTQVGFWATVTHAVAPFIPFDVAKAFLAAACASVILPQRRRNRNEPTESSRLQQRQGR